MTWGIPFSMAAEIASDVLLKGTAVLLAASVATWLLRTKSAAIRHVVWSLAFVVLLALPILAGLLPSWRIELFRMSVPAEVTATQFEGMPTVEPSALRNPASSFSYFHYPTGDGPFRRIDVFQLFGSLAVRNEDGSVESAFVEHDFDLQWKSGGSLGLDLELYYEDVRQPLSFPSGTSVPVGSYTFPRFEGDYSTPRGNLFRAGFNWGVQKFYDGWRANVGMSPVWNASRFLELNARYQVDFVRFPDRNQGFDAHILRLRSRASFNTKFSVNAFVQVSNASDYAAANVRFRYNFREGNDLWVVYNEGVNLDRDRTSPSLPFTDTRTVLLKYTHTFRQ